MTYGFKNLVFEGGGVKGIAYVGAMEIMEAKGVLANITRVGGTSAGAINAVLAALNYSNAEVRQIMETMNFNDFMDDDIGVLRDVNRLTEDFGWFKGDFFLDWVGDLIEKKSGNRNLTFKGLKSHEAGFRDLYVCATNLSTHFSEVFSADHTPSIRVADAVRMSMSIPLFFKAVKQNSGKDVYVDGGVLRNFPIKLFDRQKYIDEADQPQFMEQPEAYVEQTKDLHAEHPKSSPYVVNNQTLGFRLDTKAEIATFRYGEDPSHYKIDSFFDFAKHLMNTMMDAELARHLESDDWKRTIYIDTLGVKTTEFDIDDEKKSKLVHSGMVGAEKFFDWYDQQANE